MKTLFTALLLCAAPAGAQELTDITPAMVRESAVTLPSARPVPVAPEADKKLRVCWIKAVENDACVYKCNDGSSLREPLTFSPGSPYATCPQLVFPLGKPKAAPQAVTAPDSDEADKKLTVCWIKGVKENTCVYKCNNGRTLEQTMQQPVPGSPNPVTPCPQLVFPHKAEAKAEAAPAPEPAAVEKKAKACWIKKMKDSTCSYKCSDGSLFDEPMFNYPTGDMVPLLPCPPVIFQFGK